MPSYVETYKSMLSRIGENGHLRETNVLRRDLSRLAPDSAAYKKIAVNGVEQYVLIKSSDAYTIKEIVCMPGERVLLGSIVDFCDVPWLVTERDYDDEIYGKSKMRMCNAKLRWKDSDGTIHEYDGWADDATKYSEGVEHTRYIRVGEFQLKVFVPVNEVTSTIWRDMRFLIDAEKYIDSITSNSHYPYAFKVTRRNIVTGTYEDEGYVEITLVEDEFIVGKDDAENMIAAQVDDSGSVIEYEDNNDDEEDEDNNEQEGGWL